MYHGAPADTNSKTQRQRILDLLLKASSEKREVSLVEILALKIGQYGTRIKELRSAGWKIVNRTEWHGRARHSWFSLRSEYPSSGVHAEAPKKTSQPISAAAAVTAPGEQQTLLSIPVQPRAYTDPAEGAR